MTENSNPTINDFSFLSESELDEDVQREFNIVSITYLDEVENKIKTKVTYNPYAIINPSELSEEVHIDTQRTSVSDNSLYDDSFITSENNNENSFSVTEEIDEKSNEDVLLRADYETDDETENTVGRDVDELSSGSSEAANNFSELNKEKFIDNLIRKLSRIPESKIQKQSILTTDEILIENHFFQRKLKVLKEKKDISAAVASDNNRMTFYKKEISLPNGWKEKVSWMALNNKIDELKAEPEHIPENCYHCRYKQAEIEKHRVLKQFIGRIENKLIESELNEYFISHNSINLIGEICRSLPKYNKFF